MRALPVANARMYSATPSVKADWKELLGWVLKRAGLRWEVIDYDAPAPLSVLWARDDLGLAMMCGLPFARRAEIPGLKPTLIAAPVPSLARYAGKPVYFTDIVVRADSQHQTLENTFDGVIGYTLVDSMSGGVALRCHLEGFRNPQRPRLYRKTTGGFVNARNVIEALVAGAIDAGPLDSYYHDLLKRNDPGFAAQVRLVASTAAMPIPPLVATAALAEAELSRLQAALLAVSSSPELATVLERLQLSGFALAEPESYDVLADMAGSITAPFENI